jgi:threonine synthase
LWAFECVNCAKKMESDALDAKCTRCGSALLISSGAGTNSNITGRSDAESLPPGVWRFKTFLPEVDENHVVTLGEGATPLMPARRLGTELGFDNLMIKDETRNPTGSFIDRGSTVLVSLAMGRGVKRISCTTTGNLGASLAAYCAKAGIKAEIKIHPNTDHGKLYQMIAYGAEVEVLSSPKTSSTNYDSGFDTLSVSAANPFILEGEKTTALEIVQDMDWIEPDAIVVPVGTGGHLSMIWRGLSDLRRAGWLNGELACCKLIGVQIESSAPIVGGLQARKTKRSRAAATANAKPFTELEESEPIFKKVAIQSIKASNGQGVEVSTREAVQGTSLLARTEGVFAEPASASVVSALRVVRENGLVDPDDRVVCVITGAGLKDTKTISRIARTPKHIVTREELLIRPLQIGTTKLKVMQVLTQGPRFGYDIWKSLSSQESITKASIYQHLSELEGIALVRRSRVTTVKGRERIFYELTGKAADLLKSVAKRREGDRFMVD